MADLPISGLTSGGGLRPTDEIPINRGGANFKAGVAPSVMIIALSDEVTALSISTAAVSIRMPLAMTLTEVRASVVAAPVGSTIIVDINQAGTTILSTKLSIDDGEFTSTTAAVPAVISTSALTDDALVTFDIDQVGSGTEGAGLKVYLIGYPT